MVRHMWDEHGALLVGRNVTTTWTVIDAWGGADAESVDDIAFRVGIDEIAGRAANAERRPWRERKVFLNGVHRVSV